MNLNPAQHLDPADPLAKAILCLHAVETQLLMGSPCIDPATAEAMRKDVSKTQTELASVPPTTLIVDMTDGVIEGVTERRPNVIKHWGLVDQELAARRAMRELRDTALAPDLFDRIFIVAEGVAGRYGVIAESGQWSFPIHLNGEARYEAYTEVLERIVGVWNANVGAPTDGIEHAAQALRSALAGTEGTSVPLSRGLQLRRSSDPVSWTVVDPSGWRVAACRDGQDPWPLQFEMFGRVVELCNAFAGIPTSAIEGSGATATALPCCRASTSRR